MTVLKSMYFVLNKTHNFVANELPWCW